MKNFFEHGELTKIADSADMPLSKLSDVLHRKRGTSMKSAKRIALAIMLVTNKKVEWVEILNNRYSKHPMYKVPPLRKDL